MQCRCQYCTKPYKVVPLDKAAYHRFDVLLDEHKRRAAEKRYVAPTLPSLARKVKPGQQAKQKPEVIMITALGKTMTITQWSRETRIPYETLKGRYERNWKPHDIVTLPRGERKCRNQERCAPAKSLVKKIKEVVA